ncbi:MAG: tryptophan--tRNA ligase [Candidatus Saccharimonadales bacterium]
MSKKIILTGLRANNDLHIGNYFGALLPMIDMAKSRADEYQINLFVPDLHSFTTPIDHSQLQQQIMHNLKLFVAAGLPLDHPNVHIYRQSYVPAHSELTVILNSFTSFGEMRRMTQFKDKSGAQKALNVLNEMIDAASISLKESAKTLDNAANEEVNLRETAIKLKDSYLKTLSTYDSFISKTDEYIKRSENLTSTIGLFDYPVLMAADILLYNTSYVPVGEDQTQHLEFTRDIAERMNAKFGELFTVPEPVKKQHEFFGHGGADKEGNHQGLRIKDLADPSRKMSKSEATDKGVIFLGDSPEAAASKVMSAATDSVGAVHLDYDNQPGVSNLLQILALLQNRPLQEVAAEYDGRDRYGDFKKEVAEAVQSFLADFQQRLANVDEAALMAKLTADEQAMNQVANETLNRVQKAIGLR